jgi:HemY protein
VAARGLLRSLAGEAIDETHDLQQLKRLWQQLDPADRRDAAVAARAASRAVALASTADARDWLRPFWDRLGELERDDRDAVALALFDAAPGIEQEWLPRLEAAIGTFGHEAPLVAAVGMAFADRQLWGKARKLLEPSAAAPGLPPRVRRRVWRALAQMAREGGDEARAQECERAAAALE